MYLMKGKNILAEIKSKSLKEAKDEINEILNKLEKSNADLEGFSDDYQRLIHLNKHIYDLFKKKTKNISKISKKIK